MLRSICRRLLPDIPFPAMDAEFRLKARSTHLLDNLAAALGEIAALRQQIRDMGLEPLTDLTIRQLMTQARARLVQAGLSQEQIDATPGLEPLP